MRRPVRAGLLAGLLALIIAGAACGSPPEGPTAGPGGEAAAGQRVNLGLGYFPNVTHAAAVAGVERGILAEALGPDVTLKPATFNAGPSVIEALFAGGLDAAYIGPNPAVNAFARSGGEAIRIIAGATSGGAALVVKPGIDRVEELKGHKVATPQLGNTQDVALRAHLLEHHLKADLQGGGDVHIVPQENSQTLELFKAGTISGAWVPEPWATRLVQEGGGKVLVDERTLWPGGRFVTTHLIVRTKFLGAHPDVIGRLLEGHLAATEYATRHPTEAQAVVNAAIERITGRALPEAVIAAAWNNLDFTVDPVARSLREGADDAKAVGLLDASTSLDGIYDLTILNRLLTTRGQTEVEG